MVKYQIESYPQDKFSFRIYINNNKKTWQQIKKETGCHAIMNLEYYNMTTFTPDMAAAILAIEVNVNNSGGGGGGDLDALIQRTITEIHNGATSVGSYAFQYCYALTTANFPLATSIGNGAFSDCLALTTVDFPLVTSIGVSALSQCYELSTLILRKNAVCKLDNINAFTDTPIAYVTGHVYVPASLVGAYKAATNWAKYAKQIRAIEDYPGITGG